MQATLLRRAVVLVASLTPSTYTAPVRAAAARQIHSSVWQILPGFVLFCGLLSYLVSRIVVSTARDYGLSAYALDVFVRLLVLELIPLFVALFVALRSGAAIGTEVALMRVRGDFDSLRQEGEDPLRAELLPRCVGNAAAVVALTAIGSLVAMVVAYVGLYGLSPWGHAAYSRAIGQVFAPVVLVGFALKVAFFAVAVAVIPVAAGLAASRDARSVPEAAPRGLVRVFVSLALVEAVSLAIKYM